MRFLLLIIVIAVSPLATMAAEATLSVKSDRRARRVAGRRGRADPHRQGVPAQHHVGVHRKRSRRPVCQRRLLRGRPSDDRCHHPAAPERRNGSVLNLPPVNARSGFDSRVAGGRYDPSLVVQLPVAMKPGDALVSSISVETMRNCRLRCVPPIVRTARCTA